MKKYFIISVFLLTVICMSFVSTAIIYTKCIAGNSNIVEMKSQQVLDDVEELESLTIYK